MILGSLIGAEMSGVSSGISLGPVLLLLLLIALAVIVASLLQLRRRPMNEIPRVLWVFLIIMFPIIGSIAFFIVQPGDLDDESRTKI